MATLTIATAAMGAPTRVQLLLTSAFRSLKLEDGTTFQHTTRADADIVLVNLTDTESGASDALISQFSGATLIQCGKPVANIKLTLARPLTVAGLYAVLKAAARDINRDRSGSASSRAAAPMPHRQLAAIASTIDAAEAYDQARLSGFRHLDIRLWPTRGLCSVKARDGNADWQSRLSSLNEAVAIDLSGDVGAPGADAILIDQLKWQLALRLSHGVLLRRIADSQTFSLSRWPDLGKSESRQTYMRLAALIGTRGISLEELLNMSKLGRDQVIGFLNACAVSGCLAGVSASSQELHSPVVVQPAEKIPFTAPVGQSQHRFLGVLGKLRSALGLTAKEHAGLS